MTTISESLDRKSTRLNSSHQIISYAVFCLKKNQNLQPHPLQVHRQLARPSRPGPSPAAGGGGRSGPVAPRWASCPRNRMSTFFFFKWGRPPRSSPFPPPPPLAA